MKRRMKRFAEGGVGYEEDPKPGRQSDMPVTKRTKTVTRKTSPRKISSMEFIQEYESDAPSGRMQKEAESTVRQSRSGLPGDRSTDFKEQRGIAKGAMDLDQEDVDRSLETMADIAAIGGTAAAAGAKLPLRAKQMLRRMQTARANAAERAADKAGEASRRGMSRRGLPRYDERYRAQDFGETRREAAMPPYDTANRLPAGLKFKKGGHVKSSASRRADGIAQRGKTRGKYV